MLQSTEFQDYNVHVSISEVAKKIGHIPFCMKYFHFKTFPSPFAGNMFSRIPLKLEKMKF